MQVEKELGLTNLEGLEKLNGIEKEIGETTTEASVVDNNCDKPEEDTKPVLEKAKAAVARLVASPQGMDPTKPRQGKAKLARRERWEKMERRERSVRERRERTSLLSLRDCAGERNQLVDL